MSELTNVPCAWPDCPDGVLTTSGFCNRCGRQPMIPEPPRPPEPPPGRPGSPDRDDSGSPGRLWTPRLPRPLETSSTPSAESRDPRELPDLPRFVLPDRPTLLPDPHVPPALRECAGCGSRVAQPGPDGTAMLEGTCSRCGKRYSFGVKLAPGDLVDGRYEIRGAIAHGGMGWVYAAIDWNLDDSHLNKGDPDDSGPGAGRLDDGDPDNGDLQVWVVLKGLLDAANPEAQRIATVERRILTAVSHPNIVKILDYVTYRGDDYIVMEYVPGLSLSQLLERRGAPLPPADAIRYVLRLLPALGYLHRRGLVYCDLKPDNIMVTAEDVKLIDLGGARRADDTVSGFLSTPGYRAPELEDGAFRPSGAARGGLPTVASDIFAVTRTLARLVLGRFDGFLRRYRHSLPPREEHEPLRMFESLDLLLRRGTALDPADRFASTAELAEELTGVLYEIVSRTGRRVVPLASRWFEPDIHPTGEAAPGGGRPPVWEVLPDLRTDPDDPQARALAPTPGEDPAALADRLAKIDLVTQEVRLALARARIRAGRLAEADETLREAAAEHPREWRVDWYRGLLELARDRPVEAAEAFERVYFRLPGELAPRLALATACAAAERYDRAAELFDVVSQIDPAVTSAAFGLARCVDDPEEKIRAYERVPASAHAYTAARVRMIGVLVGGRALPDPAALRRAEEILADPRLDLGDRRHAELRRNILLAALRLVSPDPPEPARPMPDHRVLGRPLVPRDLRFGLEETYREIARLTRDRRERIRLVDEANRIRPRTLW